MLDVARGKQRDKQNVTRAGSGQIRPPQRCRVRDRIGGERRIRGQARQKPARLHDDFFHVTDRRGGGVGGDALRFVRRKGGGWVHQFIHVEPVALIGRDAASRRMRLNEITHLGHFGHFIANRCRLAVQLIHFNESIRADRLACQHVIIDNGLQYANFAQIQ